MADMNWQLSHRADKDALPLANRHYNRQSPESPQFVPPGKCLVFLTDDADALWVTSWPKAEYTKHAWAGAWVNSLFRNESDHLASELITQAVAATRSLWNAPDLGLITFVDSDEIESPNPGYCYKKAGFQHVGYTEGGLDALQMLPEQMPAAEPPQLRCGQCSHKYCEVLRKRT